MSSAVHVARPLVPLRPIHPLRQSLAAGTPTDPTGVAGLIGWWKADALALTDGASVTSWTASTGPNLAQSNGAPVFKTAIQNGLPVVRFTAASLQVVTAAATIANAGTVLAVARYTAATFADFIGLFSGTGSGNSDIVFTGNGVGTTAWFSGGWTGANYYINGTLDATNQGPVNNVFKYMTLTSTGFNTALTPQIGSDRNLGRYWGGDVGEVVVYNSVLSTANRQAIENYLKTKWGL